MLASLLTGPRTSALLEIPIPDAGPGEVLVRVEASGVCASELHDWITGPGDAPRRLGHEATGTIIAVGPGVTPWRAGDRVTGLMSHAFAEHVVANADRLLRIPPGVPADAVLGEPICCLVNALRRTRVELGDRVAVVGLGYMGLGTLQLTALRGPSRLLAVDPRSEVRDLAVTLGATEAVAPAGIEPRDLEARERDDAGFDVVFEASGTQPGLDLAGRLVRRHGILSIVGYHQGGPRQVDMADWNVKALDVVNAHVRRDADRMAAMAAGLALIEAGRLDLGRLVTHRYPLADLDRAFADLAAKPPGFVKGVIHPSLP